VHVRVWSDYLCPWCYLALDREQLLADLGVIVTILPFELHPEIPAGGRPMRAGSRTEATFAAIGAEAREVGLPFRMPTGSPNTRATLAAAEHVRRTAPEAFPDLHRGLFTAHFAEGRDIADPTVVDQLIAASGADPTPTRRAVTDGNALAALDASKAEAIDHGVTATPAFLFDNGLLVPGVQPRTTIRRWVVRMAARGG
jgi:predicted DsbA family dithiol-disulfide isomerase